MCVWQQISSTFWSASFWLPRNITWADVAPGSRPNINYADYRNLLWSLPMAIVLFIVRCCSEKYIFSSFGRSLGIKSTYNNKRPTSNRILELAYIKCNQLDEKTVLGLTKQVDTMTKRDIERWWRLRRAQDKPTTLRKFCESSWRCLYYTCSFALGLFVLWDEPWLWDIEQCWLNHPYHSLSNGVWLYITVSLALYWTLTVSQFFDIKRKDFWMMFTHHVATILSISLSWVSHYHRIGSLVLLCHDFADIFLEACKIAKYAKYHRLCDILMAVFLIVWTVSRLVFYPQLVYSSMGEALRNGPTLMVTHILVGLLVLLQCLHILWTYILLQIIFIALKTGSVKNDYRSSSDSGESASD